MSTILLLHCSAGGGHRSVAKAIEEALEHAPQCDSTRSVIADTLNFGGPLFRKSYSQGYEFIAQNFRWLCRLIYSLTDKPSTQSYLVRVIEHRTAHAVEGLAAFLKENKVDTVCCTHFLPTTLVGELKQKGQYRGKLHACVTDYEAHGFWAEPEVDCYYVASQEAANRLIEWGIDGKRIQITGIPVRRDFTRLSDTPTRDGLAKGTLKVLFVVSSLKKREVFRMLGELAAPELPLDLTIVTGRNLGLLKALKRYSAPRHVRLTVHGFEPHLERLMGAADLMVTKPGGITSSEGLCAGLPMLFVSPIPMQEVYNARFLEASGAGISCFAKGSLKENLELLHRDRKRLAAMSQACRALGKPHAADIISSSLLLDVQPGFMLQPELWQASTAAPYLAPTPPS